MFIALLITVAVSVGVLLFFFGVNRVISQVDEVEARLGQFAGRRRAVKESPKAEKESVIGARLDKAIAKQTFAQQIARDLARANLKLTVAEYLVLNGLTATFGLVAGLLSGRGMIAALIGLVVGFFAPRFYVRRRQKARRKAFNDQLGDTITLLANSLRSGYSLLQSMDMISREAPQPTAEEFTRVVREVSLGLSPEEALANLVRRISSEDLDLMVTAINVQHEVGGNLSTILETISNTIRERVRIKGEIETLVAQQKYAGYIVAGMPVLLTLFLFMLNKDYMMPMFTGIYLCMPGGGVGMIILGFVVIQKIVAIEV